MPFILYVHKTEQPLMTDLNNVLFLCQESLVVDGGPLRVGVGDGRVEVIGEAMKIWQKYI